MRSNTRSQFSFSESSLNSIQRSVFNRSKENKLTFDAGMLVPVLVDEILPGDTVNMSITTFLRSLSPLDVPMMDNLYIDLFGFFVPERLTWDNFERFMGAQPAGPSQSTSFICPTITAPVGGIASGDLGDYFGLPIGIANYPVVRAAPFRGYNLIYNEFFRDENLQNAVVVDTDDGPDTYTDYVLLRRGKRKDYFTSALPWTQKINDGSVVSIGLSGNAPIIGLGVYSAASATAASQNVYETDNTTIQTYSAWSSFNGSSLAMRSQTTGTSSSSNKPLVYANLSSAGAITVNAFRQAVQLQRLFERDARGGTRYVELLKSHFGVRSPDFRLQRPELLFTAVSHLNVHPVPQTSNSEAADNAKQGNLAAFVTGSINRKGFTKSFVEHGWLFILASVRADLSYSQGVERKWSRSTRYDFYWPALAHIGEQAILNKELYLSTNNTNNNAVFGYTGRYNEYRYSPSQISGLLRPAAAGSLDIWHLSQEFGSLPTLGDTFIKETPPMNRIKAVDTVPDFIADFAFNARWARPMSVDSIPGFVDHF